MGRTSDGAALLRWRSEGLLGVVLLIRKAGRRRRISDGLCALLLRLNRDLLAGQLGQRELVAHDGAAPGERSLRLNFHVEAAGVVQDERDGHPFKAACRVLDLRAEDVEGNFATLVVAGLHVEPLFADVHLLDRLTLFVQPLGLKDVVEPAVHAHDPVRERTGQPGRPVNTGRTELQNCNLHCRLPSEKACTSFRRTLGGMVTRE